MWCLLTTVQGDCEIFVKTFSVHQTGCIYCFYRSRRQMQALDFVNGSSFALEQVGRYSVRSKRQNAEDDC